MKKIFVGIGLLALLLTACSNTSPVVEHEYTITWKNYDGTILEIDNNVAYGATPSYDGSAPTRPDDEEYTYTWSGWDPEVVPATANQTYTANYSYERLTTTYTINFDLNGGTSASYSGSKTVEAFTKDVFFFDCFKERWNFRGWSYNGTKIFDEKGNQLANPTMAKTMTFVAMYAQTAKITIISNLEGAGNITGEGEYPYDTYVDVSAYAKQGYTFVGWYYQNTLLSNANDYKYTMCSEDVTLEARFELASLNNLSVTSEDTSKGTVAITSGSGYSNESITVVATPVDDWVFKGWYHEGTKVSNDLTYTFIMPNNDYSLVAHFFTKAEEEKEARKYGTRPMLSSDGKRITYGLYPQKNVNDSNLISNLNKLTKAEANGWYLYNNEYYAKLSAYPYTSSYTFDNGTTVKSGVTYWFKCEPITWNILSNNNGEYYILSSVLLDAHCYYHTRIGTIGGKTIYPNNYEYSDIRSWLNTDFYNTAFALGSSHIQTTNVDNSPVTTESDSNSHACDDTQDKVFLPSFKDYINSSYGFSSSNTRYCRTTDWARARGAYYNTSSSYLYNGIYWTRSPESILSNIACYVDYDGYLYDGYVDLADCSVRPALSIKIV